jgi:succinate dehydrogenase / fumarate reductase flavoprotein subunit
VSGDYQSKLTLMSESLRNDGRIWVPKKPEDCRKDPHTIPEEDRDYYLERIYPSFGNLAPRDVSSRAAKRMCDEGRGVGDTGLGVYLDFSDAITRLTEAGVRERYGNLFDIYHEITNENAYRTPMRIYPAVHYTMGGLWVDYNLMSNVPGLFVLGEANFSDHGANRLGASALMQGLADGYFVIPYTISDYLAQQKPGSKPSTDGADFKQAEENVAAITRRLMSNKGREPVNFYHKKLGHLMWNGCGMARNKAGLEQALQEIPKLREEFWAGTSSRSATGTCSRCTSGSPARTRTRSRCASTRPCTTRWVACGSTTTSCRASRASMSSGKPTSPTTAPTASVRAR